MCRDVQPLQMCRASQCQPYVHGPAVFTSPVPTQFTCHASRSTTPFMVGNLAVVQHKHDVEAFCDYASISCLYCVLVGERDNLLAWAQPVPDMLTSHMVTSTRTGLRAITGAAAAAVGMCFRASTGGGWQSRYAWVRRRSCRP